MHEMSSLLVLFIWLLVGVFPLAAVGQAPGDEDPFCKDSQCNAATTYPSGVKVLMDSRNYAYLIGGVWDQLERDGDTDVQNICSYNRWRPSTNEICCQQVRVCGYYPMGRQDNWLFTQHISKNVSASITTTIFVNVTYEIGTVCKVRGLGCKRHFELYYYVVNSKQSRRIYHDVNRYNLLSTISPENSQFESVNEEHNFTLSPQQSGFYIAIRDSGTCVSVSRITVYRYNDINECSANNGGCSQICTSFQGLQRCSCRTGYTLASDGITCIDIDECNSNNGGCSQICTNVQGSPQCSCKTGFTLASDGVTCADINECNSTNGGCLQVCTNTEGSHLCSCRYGFILASDGINCTVLVMSAAPFDADFRCMDPTATDPSFQPYPEDWRVLFDTWSYESLLFSGGVLQVLNSDGEGNGWTGQQSTCREQLRVCDYRQITQPQNNWVFTQYISYLEANEVIVNVSYDYTSCATNRANGCTMLQTTMYLYERNGADNSARTNPNNYLPNELQVLSAESRGTFTSTFTFLPSANINGFYLGVQDTGTCGNINRITVYYRICPGETPGLVTLPETPLPPVGTSQYNTKTGTCAANSSPTNPRYRAFADGRCETSGSCDCDSGFRLNGGSSCVACPAGTYRSASDPAGSCLNCPENTDMTREEAQSCACVLGYYRTATEGAGVHCMSPPTGCTNLAVQSTTSSSAVIIWNRPVTVGRPDYYYNVEVSDPDRVNTLIQDNDENYIDGRSRPTYTLSGLRPHTSYVIRVSVHNGVSDQDPNGQIRLCEVNVMTLEGVPGPPSNPRGLCTVVVWQEPEQPNGVISGYEIRFFRGRASGVIIPKDRDEPFHVVEDGDIPSGGSGPVTFQVRAKNGRQIGPWTVQVSLGCPDSTPTPSPGT